MDENKKLVWWIVGGVAVGIVIIYVAISGGVKFPAGTRSADRVGPLATTTPQGIVAAPGLSPVSDEGQVVTREGKPVQLNTTPGSPEAPQQSNPIAPQDLPSASVKLSMSASGISPSTFRVRRGDAVTLAITASDSQTHVFMFDDAVLSSVAVGVGPGETRAITFNAPARGEYAFHCDVPGHAARGETGKMIVE